MGVNGSGLRRAVVVAAVVGLSLISGPAANAAVFVDDTPEPAWRTNGVTFATKIVGDTLVVGGRFTEAISPTGQHVARTNLAAFSLSTGALLTGWQANANAEVRAIDSDGTDVWVGGYFTQLAGQARGHIGQARRGDRRPRRQLRAQPEQQRARTRGGGRARSSPAAPSPASTASGDTCTSSKLDAATGAVDPLFTASASKAVLSMVKAPTSDVIYIGGQFDFVNGVAREGVSGLDFTTGAVVGPPMLGSQRPTYGLDIGPDGSQLYGALVNNTCIDWRTSNGTRAWGFRTEGNVQAVKYFSGTVYCGFHDAFQGDETLKLLAADAVTGALDPDFRPSINYVLRRPVHRRDRWRGRHRRELHRGLRRERARACDLPALTLFGDRYWTVTGGVWVNQAMPCPRGRPALLTPCTQSLVGSGHCWLLPWSAWLSERHSPSIAAQTYDGTAPKPGYGVTGAVYATAVAGDTLFVGGTFLKVTTFTTQENRPAVPRRVLAEHRRAAHVLGGPGRRRGSGTGGPRRQPVRRRHVPQCFGRRRV